MKTTAKLLALAAFAGMSLTSLQAATLVSRDHTDIGIAFEDGAFHFHVHLDAGLEYEADEAVIRALPGALTTVPANPAFAFLGAAGADIYILSQDESEAETAGTIYLGIGADEVQTSDFVGDLTVKLTGVVFTPEPGAAPGADFKMYTVDTFGTPTVHMDSGDGITAADFKTVTPGSHSHVNWAFTKPGRYEVTFEVSGTRSTAGNPVITAEDTFTFVVKSPSSVLSTQVAAGELIDVNGTPATISKVSTFSTSSAGGGAAILTVKPATIPSTTITPANDSILAFTKNYETHIIAREGFTGTGFSDVSFKTFNDAIAYNAEAIAFTTNLAGTTVTGANNTALYGRVYDSDNDVYIVRSILREGDAVPGYTAYLWRSIQSYLPSANGVVHAIATAQDPITKISKTFVVRAVPNSNTASFDTFILAATGETLTTDSGVHTIKSITRPTRPGQRSANDDADFEVTITFADKAVEVVRFGY